MMIRNEDKPNILKPVVSAAHEFKTKSTSSEALERVHAPVSDLALASLLITSLPLESARVIS
jgi:hypothetical protein